MLIAIIVLAVLIGCWIYAEYRCKTASTRICVGGLVMFILGGTIYAGEVRHNYREVHHAAAIRLLGEAIENGDLDSAKTAISQYNERKSAYVMIESLTNRSSEK